MKSTDDLAKCIADFGLVNPESSESWAAYFAQRHAAASHVGEALGDSDDEESDEESDDDRPAIYEMSDSAVDDVLGCTDLDDAESKTIHDGIFLLSEDVEDDGDMNIRSAEVLSRIYSPTNPAAVDVYIEYHHRTRYSSVEFFCNMYFRVHNPVAGAQLDLSTPEGRRKMHRFRPLLQMGLADMPPGPRWRAVNERTFSISASQARTLHRVLFGKASKKGLANKISVREMLRLLLASVGIALYVATDPKDEGDLDKVESGDMCWEGIEGSARWLGRNIRSVADCAPMKRDAEDSDDGFANEEYENEGGFTDDENEEGYLDGGWF
ncbi:hypothetical protein B0H10DRAFT_2436103 [Mycena sp. CBHHK59/15]|nr:hypothetical protein B0H10DRAFT_2436103 [Mycena sp. CBHHK59/15]